MKTRLNIINQPVLLISALIILFLLSTGHCFSDDRSTEILKVSPLTLRLNPPTPGVITSQLSATGELSVEINTSAGWKLKWEVLSEGHSVSSVLGNEISGRGRQRQIIPFKWKFDWMMPPGNYELPMNITLITEDGRFISKDNNLPLKLPFLGNIVPKYAPGGLHITEGNYQERQVSLQIQANAPWTLEVLITKSNKNLVLQCTNLYNSSSVHLTTPSSLLIRPDQTIILAQGEKGADHKLILDWQKPSSLPIQAGDYNFYLHFHLLPARGRAF